MNARLADLIAGRYEGVNANDMHPDHAYLVRSVFPLISSQAHKGLRRTGVPGFVNDTQFQMLRDLGYVVRHDKGLQMTTIEWCYQAAIEGGKAVFISPAEHNRRIDEYQAKLKGSVPEAAPTVSA